MFRLKTTLNIRFKIEVLNTLQAKAESLALKARVFKDTGVQLPSFYNPQLVNPAMFAQQQAKRNKLWSKAKV